MSILEQLQGQLEGRKITKVFYLDDQSVENFFGFAAGATLGILLDDGQVLVPLQDEEGNGPGWIEIGKIE